MGSNFRARRGLRALVVATVISLTLGATMAAVSATTPPPTNLQRAQRGAQWLANQIKHNGGFVKSFGVADPTDTAYAIMGLRAAGVDKPATDKAIQYLAHDLVGPLQLGGHESPGALADYIMAAVADGKDPRHFGGTAAKNNLVTRLISTQRTTGADAGLFGLQDPTFDGAFREGLALAALKAAKVASTNSHVIAGIAWLGRQQCANGLWQAYRANTGTPCAPGDPNTFSGPDTNSSALAIQGLAAWNSFPHIGTTQRALVVVQSGDAGWPYIAAHGQASDPDSTALVIQALVAEQARPGGGFWNKGTRTPFTALASYQLGCTNSDYGAFFFPGSTTGNVFATVQAVPAMAGKATPVAPSSQSVIVPLPHC